jgi:hypothetical protein
MIVLWNQGLLFCNHLSLFIFNLVSVTSHQTEALAWIKEQPSTLLLLDLDDQEDDSLDCFASISWVSSIVSHAEDDNVPIIGKEV